MTNVPNEIREMWADVYKLFDLNYNLPNTAEAWSRFWEQAEQIRQKYPENPHLGAMIIVVSEMIEYNVTKKILHPCTLEDMKLF